MRILLFISLFVFLPFSNELHAQKQIDYTFANIPPDLIKNANAVIRLQETKVDIHSFKDMTVKKKRIVTVLNKYGDFLTGTVQDYDSYQKIVSLEATVYDKDGKYVKKFKQKDFLDQSDSDGYSIYTDDRYYYIRYTPPSYPYTMVFETEFQTSTTAFIESWYPISNIYVSTQESDYQLNFDMPQAHRIREMNFEYFPVKNLSVGDKFHYRMENITAVKPEAHSPNFSEIIPSFRLALDKFYLKGVEGHGNNWKDFGKWMYDDLLAGSDDLPEATKEKIKLMVKDKSSLEAAKIIHDYVQQNTRYISVQIGVGGWKPMKASEVDRLGYGDCKALTNYTHTLLEAAGVASYYSIVYAGSDAKKDIPDDFAAIQGNHAILAIPSIEKEGEMTWIDCTSQSLPFGFTGDFTDGRDVLIVKPEGGEIVKTKSYLNEDNYQKTVAECAITPEGAMNAKVHIETKGIQYDQRYGLSMRSEKELEEHYKAYWNYIPNLQIVNKELTNDRENVVFKEDLQISTTNFGNFVNGKLLFCPNGFNQITNVPDRYRERTMPLKINRGYLDEDEFTLKLPEGYVVESLPQDIRLESKFGTYEAAFVKNENGSIFYRRKQFLKEGTYPKEEYEAYRVFVKDVARNDNAKVVLSKIN